MAIDPVDADGRPVSTLRLDDPTRTQLLRQARSAVSPHRVVLRSRIVLECERRGTDRAVARHLGVSPRTVKRWRQRFLRGGCEALVADAPGRGRKTALGAGARTLLASYVDRRSRGEPIPALRAMARDLKVSVSSVHRWMRTLGRSRTNADCRVG